LYALDGSDCRKQVEEGLEGRLQQPPWDSCAPAGIKTDTWEDLSVEHGHAAFNFGFSVYMPEGLRFFFVIFSS